MAVAGGWLESEIMQIGQNVRLSHICDFFIAEKRAQIFTDLRTIGVS